MDSISSTGHQSPLELSSDEHSDSGSEARYLGLSVTSLPPVPILSSPETAELFPDTFSGLPTRSLTIISEPPPYLMAGDEPSESDWKEGVDMQAPPFTTRDEFIDYCKGQLSPERQTELTGLIAGDASAWASNLEDCKKNIKDALMAYALFKLHDDDSVRPGVAISKACNRVIGKDHRMQATDFITRFIPDDPRVWCAYGSLFGGYRNELKERACELAPDGKTTATGRNATYWLIKLLENDKVETRHAVGFLNRDPRVPCPFDTKWSYINVWKMFREITIEELLEKLATAFKNDTRPSEQLFRLANKGNEEALTGYIRYYHDKRKFRYSDISKQLRGHVKIPGHGEKTNWQAYMVHQYLKGEKISALCPDDYKEVIDDTKRHTRRHGTTRIRKARAKTGAMKSEKGKGKAKLRLDSSSGDSSFEESSLSDWHPGHFYSMRTRPEKGTFGELAEHSGLSESSKSEIEFFVEPVRRPKKKKSQPPSKKKMKLDLEKVTVEPQRLPLLQPEPQSEPQPEAQAPAALDYSTLDFNRLYQLAREKDPQAIAEYIHQLTPFITSDDEIIPLLNSRHIRPESGRWSAEKLKFYQALRISK